MTTNPQDSLITGQIEWQVLSCLQGDIGASQPRKPILTTKELQDLSFRRWNVKQANFFNMFRKLKEKGLVEAAMKPDTYKSAWQISDKGTEELSKYSARMLPNTSMEDFLRTLKSLKDDWNDVEHSESLLQIITYHMVYPEYRDMLKIKIKPNKKLVQQFIKLMEYH